MKKFYTGYSVVSKDILDEKAYKKGRFGVCLDERDLETCKRYCHKDCVVVRTYREVLSRYVEIKWVRKYPYFGVSSKYSAERYIQIGHLRIGYGTTYCTGYERVPVYMNED